MTQLLVTGIAGKSGKFFLKELENDPGKYIETGPVKAIVRLTTNTSALDASSLPIEKLVGDLDDIEFLTNAMKGVDVVLHIAGIQRSKKVVQAALDNGVSWVILVHTTGIYSKYKQAGAEYIETEKWIDSMIKNTSTSVTILRPTMIYGDLNDRNISTFIKFVHKLPIVPVVNGGHYFLQPVHAKDLGIAYHQVLMNPSTQGKRYVLSGGTIISLRSMLEEIAEDLSVHRTFLFVPYFVAYTGAWLLYMLSLGMFDLREKVQRLCEDRSYPHEEATHDFGYAPMSFHEGLQQECNDYIRANALPKESGIDQDRGLSEDNSQPCILKIGIVSQHYPPEPAFIPEQLAVYLGQHGHKVRVLTGLPNYPTGKIYSGLGQTWKMKGMQNGIEVKRVPLFPSHSHNPLARAMNYISFAISSLTGWQFLSAADVIYVYGSCMTSVLAPHCWRKKIPYVLHVEDLWPESVLESGMLNEGILYRLARWILNLWSAQMYRDAAAVVGISPSMTETLIQRGASRDTARTVYNWGPEEIGDLQVIPDHLPTGALTLLYAGNIGQAQDLATVLQALYLVRDLPGIRLDIVGDGIEEETVKKLAAQLSLESVYFHPRVSSSKMDKYYESCDFQLIPLKDRPVFRMTIPSKFQSGLARGVPVITSVQGDVANLVCQQQLGFVAKQTPGSWAETINLAYNTSPQSKLAMRNRAIAYYRSSMSRAKSLNALETMLVDASRHIGKMD